MIAPFGPGQRVQVNGPRWRRVSLALLDVLRRSGPATVVRSCSEMPLFRPGNAPRSAMGSVPIKSVNLNSLPCLLALAAIYEGATRTAAARIGGVTVQIVRDWVVKFNAHGPEGLINRKPPGQPSKLTDTHRAALQAIVEQGPIPAIHGVVRWRLIDLIQWVWEEFRITISKQTLSRELRAMNYRKLSARPRHHAKNEAAVSAFKKLPRPSGGACEGRGPRQAARDLVCGRGADWAEEQDHATLGKTRHAPISPEGPKDRLGLHLRRHLPGSRQGRWLGSAPLHDRGHDPAPERNRA